MTTGRGSSRVVNTGCEACDDQTPAIGNTTMEAAREFHRAAHDLWREIVRIYRIRQIAEWLNDRLTPRA